MQIPNAQGDENSGKTSEIERSSHQAPDSESQEESKEALSSNRGLPSAAFAAWDKPLDLDWKQQRGKLSFLTSTLRKTNNFLFILPYVFS